MFNPIAPAHVQASEIPESGETETPQTTSAPVPSSSMSRPSSPQSGASNLTRFLNNHGVGSASSSAEASATAEVEQGDNHAEGIHLTVNNPMGGNDKQFFPHPNGNCGWLEARDAGKVAAVQREVETIKKLAGLGFPVARIINMPPPSGITCNGTERPVKPEGGVWLEKVDFVESKKPKMLAHPLAGEAQANKLARNLKGKVDDIDALKANLHALKGQVDELGKHIGEMDLHFTKDGRVILLDVAPADGNQVLAQDPDSVEAIKTGMDKLIAALSK